MSKAKECLADNTKIIETPTTKEVYIYENPIFRHSIEKADLEKEVLQRSWCALPFQSQNLFLQCFYSL